MEMLKEKELRNFRSNVKCANNMTLAVVKNAVESKARTLQLPVAFCSEQIKKGGMLNSSIVDCLVIYHPEHRSDYIKFAISIEDSFIYINEFGESKNQKKLNNRQGAGAVMKAGLQQANKNAERGASVGGTLTAGALISGAKMLKSIGGSKSRQQEEEKYYTMLMSIFNEIVM